MSKAARLRLSYDIPTRHEQDFVLYQLEKLYSVVNWSCKGWDTRERFNQVLYSLDRTSSPGYPYLKTSPTIGGWLFRDQLEPDPSRAELLWRMVQDVIRGSFEHYYKVFIKQEPHLMRKALEKRWRLIIAASLPVQVLNHMIFRDFQSKTLETTGHHPSAYGLVYGAGGWKRFRDYLKQSKMNWCLDKSGWDVNSPGWVYDVCYELTKRLCVDYDSRLDPVLDWLKRDGYYESRLIFSDGRVVKQNFSGFMKSGQVLTIDFNSIAQLALHVLACLRSKQPLLSIKATGDDTIQKKALNPEAYLYQLEKAGCVVKETVETYQFMGMELTERGPHPLYLGKHLCNLLYQKEENLMQTIDSYLLNYANIGEAFEFYSRLAAILGVTHRSKEYYQFMVNSPMALDVRWSTPGFRDPVSSLA